MYWFTTKIWKVDLGMDYVEQKLTLLHDKTDLKSRFGNGICWIKFGFHLDWVFIIFWRRFEKQRSLRQEQEESLARQQMMRKAIWLSSGLCFKYFLEERQFEIGTRAGRRPCRTIKDEEGIRSLHSSSLSWNELFWLINHSESWGPFLSKRYRLWALPCGLLMMTIEFIALFGKLLKYLTF